MVVLDASAVLALLADEPGAATVAAAISEGAAIGAVNLAEVLAKLVDVGMPEAEAVAVVEGLGLEVVPFDEATAVVTARLRAPTGAHGLSLGDRAALALALIRGEPVLTTDRAWSTVDVAVEVRSLR